ncbi:MAG: hypothetical protein JSW28_07325 [Thermoplasmata archaeon]|nr:MAG: hypothetical protein JSW28_07325 [Thermoplasmata archaeon]
MKKTENLSRVIAGSLLPELDRTVPRTDVALKEDDIAIYLEINADDINALRAAMNSYLRWIKVSCDTYLETHKEA